MIAQDDYIRKETIEDMIYELECLKKYHNFHIKPISKDFLQWISSTLEEVGVLCDDVLAAIDQPPEVQEGYLFHKGIAGGHGALSFLKEQLKRK